MIYLAEMRIPGRTTRLRFSPKVSDDDLQRLLKGVRPGETFGLKPDARYFPTLLDKPANDSILPLIRLGCKQTSTLNPDVAKHEVWVVWETRLTNTTNVKRLHLAWFAESPKACHTTSHTY